MADSVDIQASDGKLEPRAPSAAGPSRRENAPPPPSVTTIAWDPYGPAPPSPSSAFYDRTSIPVGTLIKKPKVPRNVTKEVPARRPKKSRPTAALESDGTPSAKREGDDSTGGNGGEDDEVEAILGMKKVGKYNHYLVKWKGLDESHNTWETTANLTSCQSLVRAYNRQKRLSESVAEAQDELTADQEQLANNSLIVDDEEDADTSGASAGQSIGSGGGSSSSSSSSGSDGGGGSISSGNDSGENEGPVTDLEAEIKLIGTGSKTLTMKQFHSLLRQLVEAKAVAAAVFIFDKMKTAFPSINTSSSPETFQALEPLHHKHIQDSLLGHGYLVAGGYLPTPTTPERRLHKIVKGYHVSRDYGPAVDKYATRTYEVLEHAEGLDKFSRFDLANFLVSKIEGMTPKQATYLVTHLKRKKLWEENSSKRSRKDPHDGATPPPTAKRGRTNASEGSTDSPPSSPSSSSSSSSFPSSPGSSSTSVLQQRDSIPTGVLYRTSKLSS